jgi:predicted dehydrogenase
MGEGTRIRVGVAGVAGMGITHLLNAPNIDGYELTAICDVVPDALEKAAGGAPDAKRFTDLAEMCRSGAIDAVVIATPNWLHADNVTGALDAGLHVYCEKPLGVTVGECRAIAGLARERGQRVQVGFQHRFQHGYASAKRIVERGDLGPLARAEMRGTDWFRPDVYFKVRPWRARWDKAGGGVLMLQAIHQLDAFLWIAGMPSRVRAFAASGRDGVEIESDVSALLEFPDGATGVLTASTLIPGGTNRIELHGDRGMIRAEGERARVGTWDDPTSTMRVERTNPFEGVAVSSQDVEPTGEDAMSFNDCVIACHRDFIDAIRTGREPLNNADQASMSVEVCNAVYLSAVTGEPVDLPLDASVYDDVFAKMCSGELELAN